MSGERHRRIKELFLATCDLEAAARREHLERECGADEDLLREVEEMVGADGSACSPLEKSALGRLSASPLDHRTIAPAEVEGLSARAAARPYRIDGELGRGGMGVILRAHDVDLRRDLAMKVSLGWLRDPTTLSTPTGSEIDLTRFLEEARITARLDHPGVVPVHDLGVDAEGRLFFTMKLVEGRELGEVLRLARDEREGWTRTRVVGVLQKVCEAVAYAHQKGVVHRDLKPANVMVGEFGEVYVMDWGVARVLGALAAGEPEPSVAQAAEADEGGDASAAPALLTRAGSILGTPYGMPPEQARGEPVGPLADVYAVGAMLYQVLAGRRPYETEGGDASAAVVLARIRRGPPAPLRELAPEAPPELVAIAERAMAPRPEERYADMRALADDLRAYIEGRVVRAYRTGALAELRKWVARNRLAAAGLAATFLAIVGGLLWSRQLEAANRREADLASDYFRARVMNDTAHELWPAVPAMIPALEEWLSRAELLVARRSEHGERLRRLEASADLDPTAAERQRALLGHLDGLDGGGEAPGLLDAVRARLEFASTIEERSITGVEVAERWRQARESIRSGSTHAAYAGLDLAPQLGLVPLGSDGASGLWEFAHLETGIPPERDEAGRLVVTPATGLVFVLIPGGTFHMGAGESEGEPNHDPRAWPNERPVVEVTLAPFFLSKHELNQAQWERITGENPSKWQAGVHPTVTPTNPVEQVSWVDATEGLARLGLTLPTEARWEYACRAGTETPFACDPKELARFANVADESYDATFGSSFGVDPFDDGFAYHAPVGSLEPNAFGLHDMHGNVFEWVLDHYGELGLPRNQGDGLSLGPGPGSEGWWSSEYRVFRGGTFEAPSLYARSSHRVNGSPTFINHGIGLRPARELEPASAR